MASFNCDQYFTRARCLYYCENDYESMIEKELDAPMPWIGMYIAAASALCSLAMAADAFNGFRSKKQWVPCKYFSLNATSLTLLAVSMKLTVDLSSSMMGINDKLASVSSLAFMSTAMSNFITSVASMDNHEILLNVTALGILVCTIAVNVCIHKAQTLGTIYNYTIDGFIAIAEEMAGMGFLLLLLVLLASSSLVVSTANNYIESKYREMHKITSSERGQGGKFSVDELRVYVKKYWVMAETGGPQFVIARSAISGTSGLMCLLMALILLEAHVKLALLYEDAVKTSSIYKWSMNWILVIQSAGVVIGTITPLLRWFVAARLKTSETGRKSSLRDEFKIEAYWTLRLVEWRESSLPLQIRHQKLRKLLHGAKRSALSICIGVQTLFVRTGKLILFVSVIIGSAISSCLHLIKNGSVGPSAAAGIEMDEYSHYVLLLEGEARIPKSILTSIYNELDKLIQKGRRNQSKNLVNLLNMSGNFKGVREFDSNEIQSLNSQLEPPNCWSLPVVTLTSIAISLPNITHHKSKQLIIAVSEGLYFAKLIEKTLDSNGELESIRKAADAVWVGVELYKKWQDNDLQAMGLEGRTSKETLQKLSNIAKNVVTDFTAETNDFMMQNPLNWPVKVIAANSMYRITQTILLAHGDDHPLTDEETFERLSIMISDILSACLTNLERVIMLKCHSNAIKEREKSIRQAALLLGESEKIVEILRNHEVPSLDPEKAANIEGWRAFFMEVDNENTVASVSATFQQTHGGHVSIELGG